MAERISPAASCPACGTEVPDGARFCQNCGAALDPGAPIARAQIPANPPPTAYPPVPMPTRPPISSDYAPSPYGAIPGYGPPPTKSGKAVAGFWLGIASIPCCLLNWIGIVVGILGLIFGVIGLSEARRVARLTGETPIRFGYRQAWIGIVCALIGILASAAVLIYLLNNLDKYGIKITR